MKRFNILSHSMFQTPRTSKHSNDLKRHDYVTFTSTCGTPLTATTLHLQGITKEAVPHSDPSTLGNAVESQYMEGIYKANTHARLRYCKREKGSVHAIPNRVLSAQHHMAYVVSIC
jgi:hypothetical protein